jgi:hypothetical protein
MVSVDCARKDQPGALRLGLGYGLVKARVVGEALFLDHLLDDLVDFLRLEGDRRLDRDVTVTVTVGVVTLVGPAAVGASAVQAAVNDAMISTAAAGAARRTANISSRISPRPVKDGAVPRTDPG